NIGIASRRTEAGNSRNGGSIDWRRYSGMPYEIIFAPPTEKHLAILTAAQRKTVFDAVAKQLKYEPTGRTKNRKPMEPNPLASWELRIGILRVYYDVHREPPLVSIVAVGTKERNEVRIAGKVYRFERPL